MEEKQLRTIYLGMVLLLIPSAFCRRLCAMVLGIEMASETTSTKALLAANGTVIFPWMREAWCRRRH